MQIILRSEAKKLGLKRYFTGNPCKHGHFAERRTGYGNCVECQKEKGRKYDAKRRKTTSRKDYMKKYSSEYYKERKSTPEGLEKVRAESRATYARNAEKERTRSIEKRKANRDYYYQKCAERRGLDKRTQPHHGISQKQKRFSAFTQSLESWV